MYVTNTAGGVTVQHMEWVCHFTTCIDRSYELWVDLILKSSPSVLENEVSALWISWYEIQYCNLDPFMRSRV
jgi:hypothetical protein